MNLPSKQTYPATDSQRHRCGDGFESLNGCDISCCCAFRRRSCHRCLKRSFSRGFTRFSARPTRSFAAPDHCRTSVSCADVLQHFCMTDVDLSSVDYLCGNCRHGAVAERLLMQTLILICEFCRGSSSASCRQRKPGNNNSKHAAAAAAAGEAKRVPEGATAVLRVRSNPLPGTIRYVMEQVSKWWPKSLY